jgi:hypothetical protein
VIEAAEKEVISTHATAGIYYFRDGTDFVRGAEAMIEKDIRTNGLFYFCPVFNELLQMSRRIETVSIDQMVPLGTPPNVQEFDLRFGEAAET